VPDFLVLARDFERMLHFIAANVRPKSLMDSLHRDLSYLANQARKNPDRSEPEENVRRWENFMREFQATGMMPQLKRQVENWAAIETFVSPKPKTMNVKILKLPVRKPLDWDAEHFLLKLFHAAESHPHFLRHEKTVVLLALKYLRLEAEKKRERRDQEWIRAAWRAAHPILERNKLLAAYRSEPIITNRLKAFIAGNG
jgi:hypothetical protein